MYKYYLLDSIYWLSVVCGFISFKVEAGDNLYVVEAWYFRNIIKVFFIVQKLLSAWVSRDLFWANSSQVIL